MILWVRGQPVTFSDVLHARIDVNHSAQVTSQVTDDPKKTVNLTLSEETTQTVFSQPRRDDIAFQLLKLVLIGRQHEPDTFTASKINHGIRNRNNKLM